MHVRILIEKELSAQNEIFIVFLSYCFCQIKDVGMMVIPKGFFSWLECLLDASKKEY